MTIEALTQRFRPSLTDAEAGALDRGSLSRFVLSLLRVYEQKAEKYLSGSESGMKDSVRAGGTLEALVNLTAKERVVHYGHTASLEINPLSFLPSLIHLLGRENRELCTSIGCATYQGEGEHLRRLDPLVVKAFQSYIARRRFFLALGAEEMRTVIEEIRGEREEEPFPPYLAEAFIIEQACGAAFQAAWQNLPPERQTAEEKPRIVAHLIEQNGEAVAEALRAILIYVGTVLRSCEIAQEDRAAFFAHLATPEALDAFSLTLAQAYVRSPRTNVWRDHLALCNSAAGVCRPALRFLGMSVQMAQGLTDQAIAALNEQERVLREAATRAAAAVTQAESQAVAQLNAAVRQGAVEIDTAARDALARTNGQFNQHLQAIRGQGQWSVFIGLPPIRF